VAQENRIIVNGFYGQLSAGITASATTLVDTGFQALPTVTGTADYVPLAFTDSTLKLTEIMWVTAHASSSSTITVVRAKESTTARAWTTGTTFAQAETTRDGLLPVTSGTIPSDLHVGARVEETDTKLVRQKTFTAGTQASVGVALPSDVGPRRSAANPGTGDTILIRTGNGVIATNGSGDATVNFRVAFPNACCAVTANSADAGAFTGFITITNETASSFDVRCNNVGGGAFNGTMRISYIATGW
jgi:hypothetical protein